MFNICFCIQGDELSISDLQSLHAPLDIPIPDPPAPEDEVSTHPTRSQSPHLCIETH